MLYSRTISALALLSLYAQAAWSCAGRTSLSIVWLVLCFARSHILSTSLGCTSPSSAEACLCAVDEEADECQDDEEDDDDQEDDDVALHGCGGGVFGGCGGVPGSRACDVTWSFIESYAMEDRYMIGRTSRSVLVWVEVVEPC